MDVVSAPRMMPIRLTPISEFTYISLIISGLVTIFWEHDAAIRLTLLRSTGRYMEKSWV